LNLLEFFEDKTILVCGGTGSIGSEIVSQLLNWNPKTIRILSNSENELWETKIRFNNVAGKIRFLLGDIRDLERVKRAVADVDYVFNSAAVKHVPFCEYNPMEAININIHGLENIIEASLFYNVRKLVHISTDKAVVPTTVMGATKMLGERLCISRDFAKGSHPTTISCVRFGNVLGSRGSILPLIEKQIENGNVVTLTDENMKRFFMSIRDAANLVLKSMVLAQGGEIFVLKMPTIRIIDLLEALVERYAHKYGKNPSDIKIDKIGTRIGEKLDEDLISPIEFSSCYETDDMYIVFPTKDAEHNYLLEKDLSNYKKVEVNNDFIFNSANKISLNKEEIKNILDKIESE